MLVRIIGRLTAVCTALHIRTTATRASDLTQGFSFVRPSRGGGGGGTSATRSQTPSVCVLPIMQHCCLLVTPPTLSSIHLHTCSLATL
jgi:hypothetical protein